MHASMERLWAVATSGRVRAAVKNHSQLAELLNESPQTVHNWKTRGVSESGAITASRVFRVPADYILEGTPLGQVDDLQARGVAQDMSQRRPILPTSKVTWEELEMGFRPDQPFELDVRDGAFGSDIPVGVTMKLDPRRKPLGGWPVLVRDRQGRHYLRDYQQGAGDHFQAVARVRGFLPLDSVEDGLEVIAVMKGLEWP